MFNFRAIAKQILVLLGIGGKEPKPPISEAEKLHEEMVARFSVDYYTDYVASVPGEYPKKRTGILASSLKSYLYKEDGRFKIMMGLTPSDYIQSGKGRMNLFETQKRLSPVDFMEEKFSGTVSNANQIIISGVPVNFIWESGK